MITNLSAVCFPEVLVELVRQNYQSFSPLVQSIVPNVGMAIPIDLTEEARRNEWEQIDSELKPLCDQNQSIASWVNSVNVELIKKYSGDPNLLNRETDTHLEFEINPDPIAPPGEYPADLDEYPGRGIE